MASVWAELKRRNVVKIAVAYAIVGWLLVEIASTVLPIFEAPQWALQTIIFVIMPGFPLALVFAWAFELTPEGIKREKDVDRPESVSRQTETKLGFLVIGVLGIAVIFLVAQKFFWTERGPAPTPQVTGQSIAVYAAYFGDPELVLTILHELSDERVLSGDSIWRPIYKETRRLPGFRELMKKRGLEDYWSSSGNWGKFCRPVGDADFECD